MDRASTSGKAMAEAAGPAPQMPGSLLSVAASGDIGADCMARWAKPPSLVRSAVKDSAGTEGGGGGGGGLDGTR